MKDWVGSEVEKVHLAVGQVVVQRTCLAEASIGRHWPRPLFFSSVDLCFGNRQPAP